jgi:hypothetical protein
MNDPCINKEGKNICLIGSQSKKTNKEKQESKKQETKKHTTRLDSVDFDNATMDIARKAVDMLFGDNPPNTRDENEIRMRMPKLRPNTKALPIEAINKARMIEAGNTFYEKGFRAAQSQIDSSTLRGWKIDPKLSTGEGIVLSKAGETKIAFRGTDWRNINDVVTNATNVAQIEEMAPQIRSGKTQIQRIQQKYGKLPSELIGYSKGGLHALNLGDQFKIKSTTFNPFVGMKQLRTSSNVEHTVYRTIEDPVSSLLALSKKKNYKVFGIDPIFGKGGLVSVHKLEHFTSAGQRQPGGIEILMEEGVRKGQQLAHFETADAMKNGLEQGKTFTQTLDEFNRSNGHVQRVDVLEDGSLGPRIHKNSGTVEYWRKMGGSFTESEQAHFENNSPPPERIFSEDARRMGLHEHLSDAQIDHLNNLSSEQRATFMRTIRNDLNTHMDRINTNVKPHEGMVRNFMPKTSSMATGLAGAFGAHAVMNIIDPDHKMNQVASEVVEGGIAGGLGAGIASSLGAGVALGPEILAGGAAYLAGGESQKAITGALIRGGMNEDEAEAIGDVSGGVIGGITAGATASGATVAGSMLFGAELGESIGLVGGPIGVGLGMLIGGGLGAIFGGIGYIASHVGKHEDEPTPQEQAYQDTMQEQQNAGIAAEIQGVSIGNRQEARQSQGVRRFAQRMHQRMG